WEMIWDETYKEKPIDPTFNIIGWKSSYTGEPIPAEEMRDWVEQTVARILELQPRRVLEIGCGTGLVLFRVAPHCESYCATDFARSSIEMLGEILETQEPKLPVRLMQRAAEDFSEIAPGSVDLVVLNSVIQYFPNA